MDGYKKGKRIDSLDELAYCDVFYIGEAIFKNGFPIALNSPFLDMKIKKGLIYKAIKIRKVSKNGRN